MSSNWFQIAVALVVGAITGTVVRDWFRRRAEWKSNEVKGDGVTGPGSTGGSDWLEGSDLLRYPDQLAELEGRLDQSCLEAQEQVRHLEHQRDRVGAKSGETTLRDRYEADAKELAGRHAQLQRVLGLVWRTRSILLLRVRVAIVARACPRAEELPGLPSESGEVAQASDDFRLFRLRVRKAMTAIRLAASDLAFTVPSVPRRAVLGKDDKTAVEAELGRARQSLDVMERKMDRLSDTVAYLADRTRTRQVVEFAPLEISTEGDAQELFMEVSAALQELDSLSDLVDQRMAEEALGRLTAGISQLEQEGMDAKAETDAALEVDRLLCQFPS